MACICSHSECQNLQYLIQQLAKVAELQLLGRGLSLLDTIDLLESENVVGSDLVGYLAVIFRSDAAEIPRLNLWGAQSGIVSSQPCCRLIWRVLAWCSRRGCRVTFFTDDFVVSI